MFRKRRAKKNPVCFLKKNMYETNICLIPITKTELTKEDCSSSYIHNFANNIVKNKVSDWHIQSKKFAGAGAYGVVEIVEHVQDDQCIKLAIKTSQKCIKTETTFRFLFSPDLVTEGLSTIFPTNNEKQMVMRVYEFTLREFMTKQHHLFMRFAPEMLLQLLKGIRTINSAGFFHNDLHNCNILVNCDGKSVESVIGDYGNSKKHFCDENCCCSNEFIEVVSLFSIDSISPTFDRIRRDIQSTMVFDANQYSLYIHRLMDFIDKVRICRDTFHPFSKVKVKVKIPISDEITIIEGIVMFVDNYKVFIVFAIGCSHNGWFYYENDPFDFL